MRHHSFSSRNACEWQGTLQRIPVSDMPADVSLAHVSDSTLTIILRLTRDDETRCIDGSVHDDYIIIIIIIMV